MAILIFIPWKKPLTPYSLKMVAVVSKMLWYLMMPDLLVEMGWATLDLTEEVFIEDLEVWFTVL